MALRSDRPADLPPDLPPEPPPEGRTRRAQLVSRARKLQARANRRLLEARERHATLKLLDQALREDRDAGGALLAGALAFRLFLWMLPAGLVVVALLGFSDPNEVSRDLSGSGLGGYTAETIARATAQAQQGRWLLLVVGLAGLYSTSLSLAKAMWIGTSLAWHLPVSRLRRPPQAAAVVAALVLCAIALSLAVSWLRSVSYPIGLVATLSMVVFYSLLGWLGLRLLPHPSRVSAVDLLPGALLFGVGVQLLHLGTALFLVDRISTSSELYGALGAAATVLFWGYLLARVLVGASTFNHTLHRSRDVTRLSDVLPDHEETSSVPVRRLPARLRADWSGLLQAASSRHEPREPAGAGEAGDGAATLSLWGFDDEQGAEAASRTLRELERQGALRLLDAAVVTWPAGARRPRGSQVLPGTARAALGGSFWGLLLGIIFFAPLLGLAVGAATGALGGSLRDAGISDAFIRQAREAVTPGTSALFVVTSDVDLERVRAAFSADPAHSTRSSGSTGSTGHQPTLIQTTLTPEQDAALRDYFGA